MKSLLGKLVEINMRIYRTLRLPPLYQSGIRYARELEDYGARKPVEDWQAVDVLYSTREGDCEDLAAARCAELRLRGVDARIRLTRRGRIWHVTVKVGKDRFEDPSKVLGMKGAA
ncbi:MAG: hypothetical protein MPL62_10040 [Alphaproteobacteria bacterium]|nr:hypothetical protein [Alphaproteobacteria bacterium]